MAEKQINRIAQGIHFNKANMGCFPDKTLPEYKILPNQNENSQRRERFAADPNRNIDHTYSPRGDAQINSKPFKRAQRQTPKKGKAEPVSDSNLQGNRFSRQPKPSVLNINNSKQRRGSTKRVNNGSIERKGGKVISSPRKQHVITEVQTPSESAKTSILAQLQNNPSVFFVKMGEKDIDLVFNAASKHQQKNHRFVYRSMSPRIQKQPSR